MGGVGQGEGVADAELDEVLLLFGPPRLSVYLFTDGCTGAPLLYVDVVAAAPSFTLPYWCC